MALKLNQTYLSILLHGVFWGISIWIINQSLAFETVRVEEIDGIRQEIYTRNHDFLGVLLIIMGGKILWAYGIAYYLAPPILNRKEGIWHVMLRLFLLLAGVALLEGLLLFLARNTGDQQDIFRHFLALGQLEGLLFFLTACLAVAYALALKWRQSEIEKKNLTEEKLSSELNFLKSQIHPHFLFNTLNNLFALAERSNQPDLSKGIADLASLMRYMLRDGSPNQVLLEKEWEMLACAIQIYQLRIGEEDEVQISMEFIGESGGAQIAPLLLLPFVENAFKHGINWKAASFIKITGRIDDKHFHFHIINSSFPKIQRPHEESSGIGLVNVQRRLNLLYPDRYELQQEEKEETFEITLRLQLPT
ncbi:MAG: histidine kinase [Bacteroidota bacterium]